jgi:hypothetical protein
LTVVTAVSGLVFFVLKHFYVAEDPFAIEGHPLQTPSLKLHILAGPLLVFISGVLYTTHVRPYLFGGRRSNRRSGLLMLVTFVVMVLSGYALQIVSSPLGHQIALVSHLSSSGLFLGGFLSHCAVSWLIRRQKTGVRQGTCGEERREAA